jgi:hypothetical protein
MAIKTKGYTGISFPFRLTPGYTGGIITSTTTETDDSHIKEAIWQIIGTSPYLLERWMLPDFGAAPAGVFDPISREIASAMEYYLMSRLTKLEDRARFSVSVVARTDTGADATLYITVRYVINKTQAFGVVQSEIVL